jgi:hypothetical protein
MKPVSLLYRISHRARLAALPMLFLAGCASQVPLNTPAPGMPRLPQQDMPPAPTAVAPAAPTPQQAMLRDIVSQQDRLYRVAAPLLVNNTELCKGNARNLLGFTATNRYSFSAELSDPAQHM